jgi:hypothetical protein
VNLAEEVYFVVITGGDRFAYYFSVVVSLGTLAEMGLGGGAGALPPSFCLRGICVGLFSAQMREGLAHEWWCDG